jgi:hypothetical protein
MRLLNDLACKTIGHQPIYFQDRITTNGHCSWHKHARCARCDSTDSLEIHTPGVLDLHARFLIGADTLRFSLTEWHRGKRRALYRLFRKRAS